MKYLVFVESLLEVLLLNSNKIELSDTMADWSLEDWKACGAEVSTEVVAKGEVVEGLLFRVLDDFEDGSSIRQYAQRLVRKRADPKQALLDAFPSKVAEGRLKGKNLARDSTDEGVQRPAPKKEAPPLPSFPHPPMCMYFI